MFDEVNADGADDDHADDYFLKIIFHSEHGAAVA